MTALDYAEASGNEELVQLIRSRGGRSGRRGMCSHAGSNRYVHYIHNRSSKAWMILVPQHFTHQNTHGMVKTRYYGCRIPQGSMWLPVCEWGNVAAGEITYITHERNYLTQDVSATETFIT